MHDLVPSESVLPQPARTIARRSVAPDFVEARSERVWSHADGFVPDFCNAYTLLLTEESQFVRIVRHGLVGLEAPVLRSQLKGWLAQETSHGIQHTKALHVLDLQGLRHGALLRMLHFINFKVFSRLLGQRLMLFVVAGLEHFNTMLGEMFLRRPASLDDADERMAQLLRWHFAEEIEHRAVIHDVATAHGMSYLLRVGTGALAFFFYAWNLLVVAGVFAVQRGGLLRLSTYRSAFRFMFVDERFVQYFLLYFAGYLRPRFHPLDRHTDYLAEPILARLSTSTTA
jgi:uncharacterized protein